jgi:hypothetical protein
LREQGIGRREETGNKRMKREKEEQGKRRKERRKNNIFIAPGIYNQAMATK